MDFVDATQVLREETPTTNNPENEIKVGSLKIGSESHPIYKGSCKIGRSPHCQVILNDTTVSKVHAEVVSSDERTFISDLRSSNGTRIQDFTIKPFFYYTINDGDAIYFGQVRAEYTTVKATQHDEFFVLDTPISTRNRNGPEKNGTEVGNVSESFLNDSSVYESDVSIIPGTQETGKKQETFQKPSTPVVRRQSSSFSAKRVEAHNIPNIDDTVDIHDLDTLTEDEAATLVVRQQSSSVSAKSVESRNVTNIDDTVDIHDLETQAEVEAAFQPPGRKRLRLLRTNQSNSADGTNIHDVETQVEIEMPVRISKRKEVERSAIPGDIYEAETQMMTVTIADKKKISTPQNDANIFDAETQVMEISSPVPKKPNSRADDIYEAETQAIEIPIAQRTKTKIPRDAMNRGEAGDDIYDAETQMSSSSIEEIEIVKKSASAKNIHNAETPIVQVTARGEVQSSKTEDTDENISEIATQILPQPIQSEPDISDAARNNNRGNDTAESSIRSNSSRGRLHLSSTPPSSPESVSVLDANQESQNLLEIVDTPLLDYAKFESSRKSFTARTTPDDDENERNVGDEKSTTRRPVLTIPESSESETDDEGVMMKFVRKSKPSNVIEDSSDEATDEENAFGDFFAAGRGKKDEISGKSTQGTSTKEQLEVSKTRGSPLRLRRREEVLPMKNQGDSPVKEQTGNVSILAELTAGLSKKNETSAKKMVDQTEVGSIGNSSTNITREKTEDSAKKNGNSALRLARKNDGISSKKNEQESSELEQAKSNVDVESSPKKVVQVMKNRESTPTMSPLKANFSLRLRRKDIVEKTGDGQEKSKLLEDNRGKSTENSEKSNTVEAAPKTISSEASSNAKTIQKREQCGNDDIDIDLLPTQILPIPSSTPIFGKLRQKNARRRYEGDDLHGAPTQVLDESSENKSCEIDLEDEDEVAKVETKDQQKIDLENEKSEKNEKSVDLDDSLAVNLGNILGEEANDHHFDNNESMMMTQNLVDILKPTQTFGEAEMLNRKSSPRIVDDRFAPGTSRSPARKKKYAPGTLGFVDGEAKDSSKELVSADSSLMKATTSATGKVDEPQTSANLDGDDEDDIFAGLPEVSIWGTLTNPGSPTDSTTSSHIDEIPSNVPSKQNPEKRRKPSSTVAATSRIVESMDRDSPITPEKSRVTRRDPSRYRITDEDSDDDFDYQDLRRIADRLLAAGSSRGPQTEDKSGIEENEKFTNIPVPSRQRNVRKNAVTEKSAVSNRRNCKLSGTPSSSVVSDSKSESTESSGESRKSSRKRKAAGTDAPKRVVAKQQRGKESQEVEAILGSVKNTPENLKKTYARVQLERLEVQVNEEKKNDVVERPKVTRLRRTISTVKKEVASPVATPGRLRNRRTVGDGPGITGADQENHKVLFTGVKDDDYDNIVTRLGGTVVSAPSKATVLITDKVRRTFKFLCAVAQGIRVVSINWLLASNEASRFLNCDDYVLKEPEAEAKYKFNLARSLEIARTKKLLEGYTIIVTPKVNQPEVHEMKGMVEACGGRLLVKPGRSWNAKTVIISREEDFTVAKNYLAKAPKNLKITVQSPEFILSGILRQEINLVDHKLNLA